MNTRVFTLQDTQKGSLVLINAGHPFQNKGVACAQLVPCGTGGEGRPVYLHRRAATMMRHLLAACGGAGQIVPVSGFRTRAEQTGIFEETLAQKGEIFTRKYVALPGCSEHETGLALDVAAAAETLDFICPSFPNSGVYAAFRQLAAGYGFIQRYTAAKTAVTGIAKEPWHFRYVGWPHAAAMVQNGWALEEYIELLQNCDSPQRAFVHRQGPHEVHSYTLAIPQSGQLAVALPHGRLWLASGNNKKGVVVSVWK